MKIQTIISCLVVLFTLNQAFTQTNPGPSLDFDSHFSTYTTANTDGLGIVEMDSKSHNLQVHEGDETSYNDSFEWDPALQKKERVIIVGEPSQLANSIGINRDVKVKRDGFMKATREKTPQLKNDEMDTLVKDAYVIVVNGKNIGGKFNENEYIKSGLKHGVPMVLENISESEMLDLIGLGLSDSEVSIVTNYTDRQGANIEIIAFSQNVEQPVVNKPTEELIIDRKLTRAEKKRAKKEGLDIKKLEQEDPMSFIKDNLPVKTIQVTIEDKAKKVMQIVEDKNKNIRSKTKSNINQNGKGERGPNPEGFPNHRGGPNVKGLTFNDYYKTSTPDNTAFDFSISTWDVLQNWSWNNGGQIMYQKLDLQVTLYASIQPYKKYLRVTTKNNTYFKPGTMNENSAYNKGWFNSKVGLRFEYENADGHDFRLDRFEPRNTNKSTQYTYSTAFTAGLTGGASSGLSASYGETESYKTSLADFEAYSSSGSTWADAKFEMGRHPFDYVDKRPGRYPTIRNLPSTATVQINPRVDAVFTAPGDFAGGQSVLVGTYHRGTHLWTNGSWIHPKMWYSERDHEMRRLFRITAQFSKVNVPHLAIDKPTTSSGVYSNWHSSRAVDGYISGSANTYAGTPHENDPYIQVDLGESKYIYDIDVWNVPQYDTSLKDYWVMVSNTPFTSASLEDAKNQSIWSEQVIGISPRVKKLSTGINGRYVRVQGTGRNYLIIGEIACNPRRDE